MRVYVTGIAGFLGSHIADQFEDVRGNDNLLAGDRENVPKHARFDFTDCQDDLSGEMKGCEVVYHTACYPHEGLSVFSPYLVSNSVFASAVSVFTSAIKAGVGKVVLCSSMSRYGKQRTPFEERMPAMPEDPYGIAKSAAEDILINLGEAHGIDWSIAVPHNIVGRRQRYYDPFRNVAAIMANRVLQDKPPIIYGDGEQTRCFSHIDDVISCLTKMKDVSQDIINIGPDEGAVTINELAKTVLDYIGSDLEPIYYPDRPQEVKHAVCSSDKARSRLGYRTERNLYECVADIVEYIKERGPRPFDYHLPIEIETDKTPITWRNKLF